MTLERRKPQYIISSQTPHNATQTNGGGEPVTLKVPGKAVRQRDEPINSRNSPTTLNILTSSAEPEDFSNRYVFNLLTLSLRVYMLLCG